MSAGAATVSPTSLATRHSAACEGLSSAPTIRVDT